MATMKMMIPQPDGSMKEETMVDIDGVIDMLRNSDTANTGRVRELAEWFKAQGFATEDQYTQLMQEADRHDGLYLS